jgi:hypothetical protein
MRRLSKFWPAVLALAVLLFGSDQVLGQRAKQGNKNPRRGVQNRVEPQAATAIETTNPEVIEAQSFLSAGVARIDAALECVC